MTNVPATSENFESFDAVEASFDAVEGSCGAACDVEQVASDSLAEYSEPEADNADDDTAAEKAASNAPAKQASVGHGNDTKVNDEKKLRLVQFAVDHAEDYRKMSRGAFNKLFSEFCAAKLE
ncbi:hypothetical protein KEM52_004203, partial [Ascosphaera acerosa]